MYRFEWSDLLVESLVERLSAVAGAPVEDPEGVRGLLTRILEGVGGSPLADSDWDADHRGRVAARLLGEAVAAVLTRRFGFRRPAPGVAVRDEHGELLAVGTAPVDATAPPARSSRRCRGSEPS